MAKVAGLWAGEPIVLASRSAGRARLLRAAAIPFDIVDSSLDERELEATFQGPPPMLASRLACEKARVVSIVQPDRLTLAGDQVLEFQGAVLHKPKTLEDAFNHLRALRGQEHRLHSAAALALNGDVVFEHVASAIVRVASVDDELLRAYAQVAGERLLATVGGYEIEGLGANLIEHIEGDMFTVVGFPLLPFLAYCRKVGLIAPTRSKA